MKVETQITLVGGCNTITEVRALFQSWYIETGVSCFQSNILKMIDLIQDLYHNQGTSPWSDVLYDMVIDVLRDDYSMDLEKADGADADAVGMDAVGMEKVGSIGAKVNDGAVPLPYFMGSMNKFKTEKLVTQWCGTYDAPYVISAKLDGISAMYVNGQLFTRGNGSHGRNISYLIPFLNIGEAKIHEGGVRGELIMKKSVFQEKYAHLFSNARNLVCGILNRQYKIGEDDDEIQTLFSDIDFVAYDIYDSHLSYVDKFKWLLNREFMVVEHECDVANFDVAIGDEYLKKWKQDSYEIDGIIVSNHDVHAHALCGNPVFAFAYKNNNISVGMSVGVVDKVIWNISKDNYLKPTIQLKTPILCDSSKVEYVTGFNAKYIKDNHISCGTKLRIGLSGSVIPHIFEVLGGGEGEWGDNVEIMDCSYTWSKNQVDLICTDKDYYRRIIKQNVLFFRAFQLKCNLQEKTLLNLYDSNGVYFLKDVLSLSLEDWIKVDKMGEKKASGIMSALYDVLHWPIVWVETSSFMDYFLALGVGLQSFERGFALKKIKLYIEYLLDLSFIDGKRLMENDYIEYQKGNIVDILYSQQPKQITSQTMFLFLDGLQQMNDKMRELHETPGMDFQLVSMKELFSMVVDERRVGGAGAGGAGAGYEFVFTGFRPKQLIQRIQQSGGVITDDISKKTNALIVKEKTKPSRKTKRAKELHIPIFDLDEFIYHYKQYKDFDTV